MSNDSNLKIETASVEDLMRLLGELPKEEDKPTVVPIKAPEQEIEKLSDSGVFNFILAKGIVAGDTKIPQDKVYEYYCNSVQHPLSVRKFFKEFREYFNQEKKHGIRYFKLKPETLGLPKDFSIYKVKYGYVTPADIERKQRQRSNDKKEDGKETK